VNVRPLVQMQPGEAVQLYQTERARYEERMKAKWAADEALVDRAALEYRQQVEDRKSKGAYCG
jgi:hypothetical protein